MQIILMADGPEVCKDLCLPIDACPFVAKSWCLSHIWVYLFSFSVPKDTPIRGTTGTAKVSLLALRWLTCVPPNRMFGLPDLSLPSLCYSCHCGILTHGRHDYCGQGACPPPTDRSTLSCFVTLSLSITAALGPRPGSISLTPDVSIFINRMMYMMSPSTLSSTAFLSLEQSVTSWNYCHSILMGVRMLIVSLVAMARSRGSGNLWRSVVGVACMDTPCRKSVLCPVCQCSWDLCLLLSFFTGILN